MKRKHIVFYLILLLILPLIDGIIYLQFSDGNINETITFTVANQTLRKSFILPRFIDISQAHIFFNNSATNKSTEFIFNDSFNRPDNDTVGNGWIQSNTSFANSSINQSRLKIEFTDSGGEKNIVFRPLINVTGVNNYTLSVQFNRSTANIVISAQMFYNGSRATSLDHYTGLVARVSGPDTLRLYFNNSILTNNTVDLIDNRIYNWSTDFNGSLVGIKIFEHDTPEPTEFNLSYNITLDSSNVTGEFLALAMTRGGGSAGIVYYDNLLLNLNGSPTDLYLEVGTIDGSREWEHTGQLTNTSQGNFTGVLQSTVQDCTCTNCVEISGQCIVPMTFGASGVGDLFIQSLNATYTLGNISLCGLDDPTINFTIRDADTLNRINANITGTFGITVNNTGQSLPISISNQNNFSICRFPLDIDINVNGNFSINFQASGFNQRKRIDNNFIYANTESLITLYLQGSGIFVRFQVVSSSTESILSDVFISAGTTINGSFVVVDTETTDDTGLAEFFLDTDDTYQITFSKTGFQTLTLTITPVSSEIQVIFLAPIESVTPALSEGLIFNNTPQSPVANDTFINFTFSLSSSAHNITLCNLTLFNGTVTIADTVATFNRTFCNATIEFDTNGFQTITSTLFYTLNGTLFRNDVVYKVRHLFVGAGSLKNFINSINAFSQAGFDNFTRMLLGLAIIMGVLFLIMNIDDSLKDAESMILGFLGLHLFFSTQGWFTMNIDTIPEPFGFPLKQYIMFFLLFMLGSSFLVRRLRR